MERLIPEKESLMVEFKSDVKKYSDSSLFEDIVAFANTDGGDLYLGVEDDGTVTGVHKDHENPTTLNAYIANNTMPSVSTRCEIIDDERPVLKISVPKSRGGIVATKSGKILRRRMKADNTPENVPMYPSEIPARLSDLRLLDFSDTIITEGTTDDIDPLEMERVRKILKAYNGDSTLLELDDEEMMKALGFIRAQDGVIHPTVTGILMVGKIESLKRFVPTAKCSFQVLEGTSVRVNEDYILPVLAAIEQIAAHANAWNPESEIDMGLYRMSVPEFDKRAMREAIVNAFCHRDYSRMGGVRVAIEDEGLTVANPGGFIEGVTIENLLTVEPHGRNQSLADALKRVGLAEKTGRGIDRIFEGSLIVGRALPDYSGTTQAMVSLFIPRSKPDTQMTKIIADEQNRIGRPLPINTLLILNTLKDMPRSTLKQIAEAANIRETMTRLVLDKMIENGIVEAYGSGKGRNYMLAHKLYNDHEKKIGYVRQRDIDEARYPELILSMAEKSEYIGRADVMNLLHVNENKAYSLMNKLVKQGMLELVQKGRYAKYRLVRN